MYRIYLFEHPERVPESFIDLALPLLPEERRQKAMRYRQSVDRKNCVIAYLMLKIALKQCFQITEFTFRYGRFGKPYLAEYPNVYFSISHCRCGCLVGVADDPIGVDIQDIRPFSWDVAGRVCCEAELEVLERCTDRDEKFTQMWAMKESYVKMTGEGITRELAGINTLLMESAKRKGEGVVAICMRERIH